ncbi:hypothetical protein PR048_030407 [Dryococelus australis]|uniref:Uncharacterized protein n=1 Tax=Dryococelus australis TaxID=614101 RepID=A0ABQ9G8X0_9NEOP|nr:hypothetical protein PR048_030407 [Dryococelus australis]
MNICDLLVNWAAVGRSCAICHNSRKRNCDRFAVGYRPFTVLQKRKIVVVEKTYECLVTANTLELMERVSGDPWCKKQPRSPSVTAEEHWRRASNLQIDDKTARQFSALRVEAMRELTHECWEGSLLHADSEFVTEFGFLEAETTFRSNLKTLLAENTNTSPKGICSYLNSIAANIIGQLTEEVEVHGSLKFNLWLSYKYSKPEPHEDAVYQRAGKTQNHPIYNAKDVREVVEESVRKLCQEK